MHIIRSVTALDSKIGREHTDDLRSRVAWLSPVSALDCSLQLGDLDYETLFLAMWHEACGILVP